MKIHQVLLLSILNSSIAFAGNLDIFMDISHNFLGAEYDEFLLGEGENGDLIQKPYINLNKFDCLTYVETIMALALSNNKKEFLSVYQDIRYEKPPFTFSNRNHFMNIDWNQHNISKGYIQDITENIIDNNGNHIAKKVKTEIDKKGWYYKLATDNKLWERYSSKTLTPQTTKTLLDLGNRYKIQTSTIYYLPIQSVIKSLKSQNSYLIKQLPEISIVEFIRKNWDVKKYIGTDLDISHIGFLINDNKNLVLRHASQEQKKSY
jgi:hypothetical protein